MHTNLMSEDLINALQGRIHQLLVHNSLKDLEWIGIVVIFKLREAGDEQLKNCLRKEHLTELLHVDSPLDDDTLVENVHLAILVEQHPSKHFPLRLYVPLQLPNGAHSCLLSLLASHSREGKRLDPVQHASVGER